MLLYVHYAKLNQDHVILKKQKRKIKWHAFSERSDSHTFEEIQRSELKLYDSPDFEMIEREIDSHEENSDLGHDTNNIKDREQLHSIRHLQF